MKMKIFGAICLFIMMAHAIEPELAVEVQLTTIDQGKQIDLNNNNNNNTFNHTHTTIFHY